MLPRANRMKRDIQRKLYKVSQYKGKLAVQHQNLHSAKTKSLSFTKSGKVSLVRDSTSEAEAEATAAPKRPSARVLNGRIVNTDVPSLSLDACVSKS